MKKIVLSILITLGVAAAAVAQNLPVDAGTGKITYLEVVDATGVSPANLTKVVKEWATKQGFTLKEEAADKLVYNASTTVEYPNINGSMTEKSAVTFTLSVFIKDGKYRYIATDFVHVGDVKVKASGGKLENVTPECGATKMTSKSWVTIKNKTNSNLIVLTDDLKRVVKEFQNDPANKSDW
ncbi:hypothetical protein [Cytophaga hutchinsonii]|uniref:DUF4468 domain-containing protein n=1 Tax=Cytophaga hutchinsonii (strain ATCC 33406 / DSM 1761 / CIP 103989 / NBRC 15051 / NCIMB 9469 / D465) TaxID=269798 RepID=A0A6N4SXP8_CYTH3|nr:hypothetical protein [Cytophaga hutchinsonii]ABG60991.1 hypothetical protein CHU_3758 [Cytophaga hutchinsonii ATCC 33406]SFX43906.1 hypothetical protein SAMN04487930_104107 [Cytophaga hutchinsonii ATCC 33406]